ncbi:MAG: hypothetical protein V1749_09440 [Candidatus Desantisbacteria bacterium]
MAAALQSFSTDLATKIEAGFETILSSQIIPAFDALKDEVAKLGDKLKDPTTEMTKAVVSDLKDALSKMFKDFKGSVSGSTKSEMERITVLLGNAGRILTEFPNKLQQMTNNLNDNFKGLQDVVQQISQNTMSQSQESIEQMRKQVEEMSETLKDKVGELQIGQEILIDKQTENLKVSERMLNSFNTSIDKLNVLSGEVEKTLGQFSKVQGELNLAAGQLKTTSETVNSSTEIFRKSQLTFAEYSNTFLSENAKTIEEIQKSLTQAKNLSSEYAQKFQIIEKGLQEIFNQIQTGLTGYRDTIGESLKLFLDKYTNSLTQTAQSLAEASGKQEDIVEELTEQLSRLKLNSGRNQ